MGDTPSLEDIKRQHETLYLQALQQAAALACDAGRRAPFIMEVDELLADMQAIAPTLATEDHTWLVDATDKWRIVLSTYLNEPRDIVLAPPAQQDEALTPAITLSEDELDNQLREKADELSYVRRVKSIYHNMHDAVRRMISAPEEMQADWRRAQVLFAAKVIDGVINFISQLTANSYWRLEEIWLREVKQFKAYCIWEARSGRGEPWFGDSETDYGQACDQLNQMLMLPQIKKKTAADFEEARGYLERMYLNAEGRLDPVKATGLKQRRAYAAWLSSGDPDSYRNHFIAETYLTLFYENIIPAVTQDDAESTLLVLKSFDYCHSLGSRYRLINVFEAALAIYFLNEKIIAQLSTPGEAAGPPSWRASAPVASWPPKWTAPTACAGRFTVASEGVSFEGVMTELQRRVLLAALPGAEHRAAVEQLFRQSRTFYVGQAL